MTRNCYKCGVELTDENWSPGTKKNGNCICKECNLEKSRLYQENNPDKVKTTRRLHYEANRDKINAHNRLYYEANRDEINAKRRLHREENRDEINVQDRLYRAANQDKINVRKRLYRKNNPEKAKAYDTKARRKNGIPPMSENKECALYLGVHRVERLLKHFFDDVEVMPFGNKGYDFVCNKGWKVDAKSSCIQKNYNGWAFHINHNTIADYFWCVAIDNRKDLNILHIWMLPGEKFNHLSGASISESTLDKWAEYEKPIGEAIICWNEIEEGE